MKNLLCLLLFILLNSLVRSIPPYFPPQIVFSPDNGQSTYAIDEINQRAYKTTSYGSTGHETSFVMQHFLYAPADSPQSKYYVQLIADSPPLGCSYGTYWKYGGNTYNSFPPHWLNGTSYKVKNYLKFNNEMIHSNDPSADEDYWYANVTCQVTGGQSYPCEEIYFKKNTDIPLRSTSVGRRGWVVVQVTINYK